MQQKCRPSLDADERRSFDVDVNSLIDIDVPHPLPRLCVDRFCNDAVRLPAPSATFVPAHRVVIIVSFARILRFQLICSTSSLCLGDVLCKNVCTGTSNPETQLYSKVNLGSAYV